MTDVLNRLDDVVVQLQLGQLLHTLEVVNDPNVLVRQLEVRQIPNGLVIIIVDPVLLVVLYGVLPNESIIDDRWLD